MNEYLIPTEYVDSDSKELLDTTARVILSATNETEKAVLIHNFVRDEIKFGWTSDFYRMKSSDVLKSRIGYCHTKATLFIAMLRAAGIPARQHFVNIDSGILYGFLERGRPYVDHSYTEVYLGGKWISLDSYVIDKELYNKALLELNKTGRDYGYGIHNKGSIEWNGREDSFIQFVNECSSSNYSTVDYGIFKDTADFYDKIESAGDSLSGLNRILIPLFIGRSTKNVNHIRDGI